MVWHHQLQDLLNQRRFPGQVAAIILVIQPETGLLIEMARGIQPGKGGQVDASKLMSPAKRDGFGHQAVVWLLTGPMRG